MIGHGANKMKKNGKNTKVNTQHSQNKPYITCKAGRYSTREKIPYYGPGAEHPRLPSNFNGT